MSSSALRKTMIVLTAIGLCLAAYLTYVHYSGTTPPCSIKGNPCSQVQKSRYSELAGVPVALIGRSATSRSSARCCPPTANAHASRRRPSCSAASASAST